MLALRANHNAVRMHQIVNRAAFAQKLWIAHNVELCAATIVTLDRLGNAFSGFNRNRALVDDHSVVIQDVSNFTRDFLDEAEIDFTIWLRRRRNGDENDLRILDSFARAAAKAQPMRRHVAMNDFLKPGFVNRDAAGLQGFDL